MTKPLWSTQLARDLVHAGADLGVVPKRDAEMVRRLLPAEHQKIAAALLAEHVLSADTERFVNEVRSAEFITVSQALKLNAIAQEVADSSSPRSFSS